MVSQDTFESSSSSNINYLRSLDWHVHITKFKTWWELLLCKIYWWDEIYSIEESYLVCFIMASSSSTSKPTQSRSTSLASRLDKIEFHALFGSTIPYSSIWYLDSIGIRCCTLCIIFMVLYLLLCVAPKST